jgi:hypothetical protein
MDSVQRDHCILVENMERNLERRGGASMEVGGEEMECFYCSGASVRR